METASIPIAAALLLIALAPLGDAQAPPFGVDSAPIQNGSVSPSVTGVVKRYLLTPVGDVEGVELDDGTDVRLPPHMAVALSAIVKPGATVNVVGFIGPQTPYGRAIKALTITNTETNQTVVDQPPTSPPPPPWTRAASLKTMTLRGRFGRYIVNDRGDIDGLFLSEGGEVKFPPHLGTAVTMAIAREPSAVIVASGYGTSGAFGSVVDAMTGSLTIGSQSIPISNVTIPPPPLPDITAGILPRRWNHSGAARAWAIGADAEPDRTANSPRPFGVAAQVANPCPWSFVCRDDRACLRAGNSTGPPFGCGPNCRRAPST